MNKTYVTHHDNLSVLGECEFHIICYSNFRVTGGNPIFHSLRLRRKLEAKVPTILLHYWRYHQQEVAKAKQILQEE